MAAESAATAVALEDAAQTRSESAVVRNIAGNAVAALRDALRAIAETDIDLANIIQESRSQVDARFTHD